MEDKFEGSFPMFFTNSVEVFPGWDWSDDREPTFYALLRQLPTAPAIIDKPRFYSVCAYGGGSIDGMTKYRGTSFREFTEDAWCVYGTIHPELGNVIHDEDLMDCARELTSSQIEQISSEDEKLKAFFEKARSIVNH